jgi:sec-independent protein translocase protein TatA
MSIPLLFDISGGELIIILLFVLLFFGSKGIPDIARTLGRTMRQVRDASNEVQREIQRGANDVRRTMEEQRRTMLDQEVPTAAPPPTVDEPGHEPPKPA